MFDVTAMGELLIDFTPAGISERGAPLFARNPGGAPANVLAMLSGLGGKAAFIGEVGDDMFGRFLRDELRNAGIDVSGLILSKEYRTTLAFVHLDANGDRTFSFYRSPGADMMLTYDMADRPLIDRCKIFHLGSVSQTAEPCRSTVHALAEYARGKGRVISYDPNYRPPLWGSAGEARKEILSMLPYADILKVSEEECLLLTGTPDIGRGADILAGYGPAVTFVTLGAEGAYCRCGNGAAKLPAYDVRTVDTTGAGDAFMGAALFRLKDKTRAGLDAITEDELRDITDFANCAGSLATTKHGAIPAMPAADEIERERGQQRR